MRFNFGMLLIAVLLAAACSIAQDKVPLPEITDSQVQVLKAYLAEHRMSPEEYVVSKFDDHDIVILGEQHRAKQDPTLVQKLIPHLYEAGVYSLGIEFGRREDQPLIDSLLNADEWNEQLARRIMLQQFVHWGYREYVDIYKAAWELNHTLEPGQRKFRILGLNGSPEWWHVQSSEDRDKYSVMKLVWHGETEADYAQVLLDEVIAKGEKALAYCGIHHGFTEYLQPKVWNDSCVGLVEDRFGRHLYNEIGKRVITIYLHHLWTGVHGYDDDDVYPADGIIDALMAKLGPEWYPVGFDTRGTPFGELTGETSVYSNCYENFTLGDFCDGYIFQMPISEFNPVTCIDGFFNENNLEYVRRNSPNPNYRDVSLERLIKGCQRECVNQYLNWQSFR